MNKLHEIQRQFRDALLGNEPHLIDSHIHHDGLSIDARLGIYRNNVFTNLREALRTLFPVVEQLVGSEFFDYAADEYIRRYPSPAGDLNQFGEHLATFFTEFEPASGLPYLPDVAQLEWFAHQVYHADEHRGFDFSRLGAIAPEHYGDLHFRLNPASALFASGYPVHRIWQVNQAGYAGDPVVNLDAGGVTLLIERRAGLIELQTLSAGEWSLLAALAADANCTTACEQALQAEPDMDLSATLARLVTSTTLVDFHIRGPLENTQ
jgi:hypothetical protein